ncbi:MAG: ADP-ribosylglycohydrolase family protein [bacterium]|nr:ADP-ribosylglycohydrolase family protein [bacterium]
MYIDAALLRDRFRASFLAHAIGDAIGKRVETMAPDAIRAATGGRGVIGFGPVLHGSLPSVARLRPEQWTDDTQLALATARALVRGNGFDLRRIAAEHVVEYMRERRGWGRSTERGIAELAAQDRQPGQPVRDPAAHGMGNGVAMKVLPLALMTAMPPGKVSAQTFDAHLRHIVGHSEQLQQFAQLTHRDACARIGAHILLLCLHEVLRMSARRDALPQRGLGQASIMTGAVLPGSYTTCDAHGMLLSSVFRSIVSGGMVATQAALIRTSCDVRESVPFVIATAIQYMDRPPSEGILAAVNAGGDTDSNAAMVGSLLGARHGTHALPPEWVERIEARDEIIALADGLFDLMLRTGV